MYLHKYLSGNSDTFTNSKYTISFGKKYIVNNYSSQDIGVYLAAFEVH